MAQIGAVSSLKSALVQIRIPVRNSRYGDSSAEACSSPAPGLDWSARVQLLSLRRFACCMREISADPRFEAWMSIDELRLTYTMIQRPCMSTKRFDWKMCQAVLRRLTLRSILKVSHYEAACTWRPGAFRRSFPLLHWKFEVRHLLHIATDGSLKAFFGIHMHDKLKKWTVRASM